MHLSWTLLIAACVACVVCDASPPWALWQFGRMIICVQPKVNPLIYNNYGCYCGFSGHGSPKDQIDQCCYVHDKCYDNTRELPECLSLGDLPHIKLYDYKCSDKTITCSASNDKCQAAVCDCDRVAANCFAQYHHTFNADYKNLPKEECTN